MLPFIFIPKKGRNVGLAPPPILQFFSDYYENIRSSIQFKTFFEDMLYIVRSCVPVFERRKPCHSKRRCLTICSTVPTSSSFQNNFQISARLTMTFITSFTVLSQRSKFLTQLIYIESRYCLTKLKNLHFGRKAIFLVASTGHPFRWARTALLNFFSSTFSANYLVMS